MLLTDAATLDRYPAVRSVPADSAPVPVGNHMLGDDIGHVCQPVVRALAHPSPSG